MFRGAGNLDNHLREPTMERVWYRFDWQSRKCIQSHFRDFFRRVFCKSRSCIKKFTGEKARQRGLAHTYDWWL